MKTKINYYPLIIIMLVAVIAVLFALLVMKKSVDNKQIITTSQQDQRVYHWKMVTSWPKNTPGLGVSAEKIAQVINEMSNGRLQIHVYGANELVPALGVFDAVSSGSVEMGHSGAYFWRGKIPASQFFTTIPFGMNAQEMNGWLHYGGGLELWREIYEPFNLIPFAAGNTGVQMAGWFKREIKTVDDLKGLKMRIPGLAGEVFSAAGGISVTIPGGELYTALQTGVIDAAEWVGPENDLAFGFQQIAPYYYYPGWHEPGSTLELVVNKTAYESLPKDLQAIITYAARAINQDMLDSYTDKNSRALIEIQRKGIKVSRLPDEVLMRLHQIANQVYEEQAKADPMSQKVYASYKQFMDKSAPYQRMSEQAYFDVRDRINQSTSTE